MILYFFFSLFFFTSFNRNENNHPNPPISAKCLTAGDLLKVLMPFSRTIIICLFPSAAVSQTDVCEFSLADVSINVLADVRWRFSILRDCSLMSPHHDILISSSVHVNWQMARCLKSSGRWIFRHLLFSWSLFVLLTCFVLVKSVFMSASVFRRLFINAISDIRTKNLRWYISCF